MNHHALVLMTICGAVVAYPDGAPEETCESMHPGHHTSPDDPSSPVIQPQSGKPFYSIIVNTTNVNPGDNVEVTLRADEYYFEGFLLQARGLTEQVSDGVVRKYGTFMGLNNNSKLICNKQAVTHSLHAHFNSSSMLWIAPMEQVQDIRFVATVVKGYKTYFMQVHSELLNPTSSAVTLVPSLVSVFLTFACLGRNRSF